MLAMSPSPVQLSEFVRWLDQDDDPMRHQRKMKMTTGSCEPLIVDRPHRHCHGQSSTDTATPVHDPKAAKKLNHNANERDRRKRINHLFSYLRSLLPTLPHHHTKKMSIPATITHVLNYIPELQQLVQRLMRRKEHLVHKISSRASEDRVTHPKYRKSRRNLSGVSTSQLGNGDVLVQMSSHKAILSEVLPVLEQDGLVLLNSSSFESSGGVLFYSLQFKVEKSCRLECDQLTDKLLSF